MNLKIPLAVPPALDRLALALVHPAVNKDNLGVTAFFELDLHERLPIEWQVAA